MNDYTDPLVILAAGDPSIIPPAFVDVLDAIVAIDPDLSTTIDRIIDELTDDHIEVVKAIAALATLRQAATNHQTFTEWLAMEDARRISHAHSIALLMDNDNQWPTNACTYTEYRDYIARTNPNASTIFDHAWDYYRARSLTPYGDADTVRTDTQYAARISWTRRRVGRVGSRPSVTPVTTTSKWTWRVVERE